MPLKDLLHKKDKLSNPEVKGLAVSQHVATPPEFTFMRTDTNSQEIIAPPTFDGDGPLGRPTTPTGPQRKGFGRLRSGSKASAAQPASPETEKEHRRLSQRLHLTSKSRTSSSSSVNVPADLPKIDDPYSEHEDKQEKEAQWEERATMLAKGGLAQDNKTPAAEMAQMSISPFSETASQRSGSRPRSISDAKGDENIQEAIRLHEAGDLTEATAMFGRLAGTGNVLSQVLYGLSLRHGWGCTPDPTRAVTYLSSAASNSASIEEEALKAGMKKGGAAKGELVLAIFELANCFRNGWGVKVDAAAARQYYETAANLGDTDAMNEAAWCYLEGFGGKKDKVSSIFLCINAPNGSCGHSKAMHLVKPKEKSAADLQGRRHGRPSFQQLSLNPILAENPSHASITLRNDTRPAQPSTKQRGSKADTLVLPPPATSIGLANNSISAPIASRWAAMHDTSANHKIVCLALALCTRQTNDRADRMNPPVQSRAAPPTGGEQWIQDTR